MAQKTITIPKIGEVTLQKRKGSKSIRLSISHDGLVKVTMPSWSPYGAGESFVRTKLDWILQHKSAKKQHVFSQFERIGKAHRLQFIHEHRQSISTRVTATQIVVRVPFHTPTVTDEVQAVVHKAAIRALKHEAKILLPGRVDALAKQHGFSFASVSIKQLKGRWGSCNNHKEITLNCFLMQLPWDLIDYVIMHELMHTEIMAHGPHFWNELSKYVTNLPAKRQQMRDHQPVLRSQS